MEINILMTIGKSMKLRLGLWVLPGCFAFFNQVTYQLYLSQRKRKKRIQILRFCHVSLNASFIPQRNKTKRRPCHFKWQYTKQSIAVGPLNEWVFKWDSNYNSCLYETVIPCITEGMWSICLTPFWGNCCPYWDSQRSYRHPNVHLYSSLQVSLIWLLQGFIHS